MDEQHEQYEYARKRVKQKKKLLAHFIIFLLGSLLLIIINKVYHYGETLFENWFVIAISVWAFLFIYHLINVFVVNSFLNEKWERKQTEKLLNLQQKTITELSEFHNGKLEEKSKIDVSAKQIKTIIVAAATNNAIGKDNQLIWHLSNDLKRFKKLTSGHHIIMGRKTFESFKNPLPNRINVVITRDENYKADNAIVVHSLEEAFEVAKNDHQPFIIGGGEIYKQALNLVDRIELTRVHKEFDADTFFPEFDKENWKLTLKLNCFKDKKHDLDYSFITYDKK